MPNDQIDSSSATANKTSVPEISTNETQTSNLVATVDNTLVDSDETISNNLAVPPVGSPFQPVRKSRKKLWLVFGGSALGIVCLASVFVFGYYLPNQPSQVWSTGMGKTGESLKAIVGKTLGVQQIENFKRSEISGRFSMEGQGSNIEVELKNNYDQSKNVGQLSLDVSGDNSDESQNANVQALLEFRSELSEGKWFPTTYLKLSRVDSALVDSISPDLVQYVDKWVYLDQTIAEKYGGKAEESKPSEQPNAKDVSDFSAAVTSVTSEYLFTDSSDKSVLDMKEFIGSEKLDDTDTYRYIATINKQKAEKYCQAVSQSIVQTELYRKISGNSDEKSAQEAAQDIADACKKAVQEDIEDDNTIDIWIDKNQKVIRKIRTYYTDDKKSYTDFSQTYSGGDEIELSVVTVGRSGEVDNDSTLKLKFNMKNYDTDLTMSSKTSYESSGSNDGDVKYDLSLSVKASDKPVQLQIPEDAVSLDNFFSNITNNATDADNMSNINRVANRLEAHYAQYGSHPTLADINSSKWRSDNEFVVPEGISFADSISDGVYSYTALPEGCGSTTCQSFTLSTRDSSGELYRKTSYN